MNNNTPEFKTFEIRYRCDDGSTEHWDYVEAETAENAIGLARNCEDSCIDGKPLDFIAVAVRS